MQHSILPIYFRSKLPTTTHSLAVRGCCCFDVVIVLRLVVLVGGSFGGSRTLIKLTQARLRN